MPSDLGDCGIGAHFSRGIIKLGLGIKQYHCTSQSFWKYYTIIYSVNNLSLEYEFVCHSYCSSLVFSELQGLRPTNWPLQIPRITLGECLDILTK